jgi:hypothetical protein
MEREGIFLNSAERQQTISSNIIKLIKEIMDEWWYFTPSYSIDDERCSPGQAVEKFFKKTRNNETQLSSMNDYSQMRNVLNQLNSNLKNYDGRISKLENQRSLSDGDVRRLILEEICFLEEDNKKLKEEIEQLKRQLNAQQQVSKRADHSTLSKANNQQNDDSSSSDQTIEKFNAWAKNPGSPLPPQFYYAEGDLKLREKQDIQNSPTNNATWIMNKDNSIKYLFPNPNAIDQISGKTDTLYSIIGIRSPRGQNKVCVQKPCRVMEGGWIEYRGELSLI